MDKQITLQPERAAVSISSPAKKERSGSVTFEKMLSAYSESDSAVQTNVASEKLILVGEISQDKQTVSELLMHNEELRASGWNILSSAQNRNRDYTRLQQGTRIYYNQENGALSWSGKDQNVAVSGMNKTVEQSAVQPVLASSQRGEIQHTQSVRSEMQELGVIRPSHPTVSHLLKADQSLSDETWNILAAVPNSSKDFSSLPPGTKVVYDSRTQEISWQLPGDSSGSNTVSADIASQLRSVESAPPIEGLTSPPAEQPVLTTQEQTISLGRIDSSNRTVSHLLMNHPQFRDQAWQLLNNSVNINKSFSRIPAGSEIFINQDTTEISWTGAEQLTKGAPPTLSATLMKKVYFNNDFVEYQMPAADLIEAVQPFIGKSYKEIDCYELLVKGLRRMDIPYEGKDGLFTKLTAMARENGLPLNAYLNGEGIVKAAGTLVLSKSYPRMGDWKDDANSLIREMEPLLDKGQILSFSTERRGHTGIVSQQDDQWTFINSGRLDNALTENSVSRGVGEEILKNEIHNWFKLAHAKGESLSVTLGQLEQNKVLTAYNMPSKFSQQI